VEAHEVAQQLIETQKLMVTTFQDASGIRVINYLPPGTPFDSTSFIHHILCGVNTLLIINVAVRQKKSFVIHMNNSPIHKLKVSLQKSRVCWYNWHLIRHTRPILLHLTFSDSVI
jgi:hypothetical protein